MPYFTGGDVIGPNQSAVSLDDFPSSFAASMNAAFTSSWAGDASVLIHDDAKLQVANQGQRLDKPAAEDMLRQSGVTGITVPDDGYTSDALNILIQRKRDDARRADILERAPTGAAPATARFAAELAGGIADPLNVAASFIPVFGEARVASLLARAGESSLARTGARTVIGAAEGAVGAAALEPIVYGAHAQLQDDYSMTDALTNLAFGGLLGAGLHVAGGAVGDLLRSGPHPAQRFTGLSVDEIQTALNFERARAGMTVEDQARALESLTPATRRALGAPDAIEAPVHAAPEAGEGEVFRPQVAPAQPGPLAAIDVASRISPELHETAVRSAVADFSQGRAVNVDNLVRMDPAANPADIGPTIDAMISDLQDKRAAMLAETSGLAEKGVIRQTRQQLKVHLSQVPETSDAAIQVRAHEIQALSRNGLFKTAEKQARAEIDQRAADHAATTQRLQSIIDTNTRAQQAIQGVHDIDAQIDGLIRQRPLADVARPTLDDVRATAQQQATPARISVADFFAARAEEQRLASAPREAALGQGAAAAAGEVATADDSLKALTTNLVQGGMKPEQAQALLDSLKAFDDAVVDAKNLGDAVRAAALCGLRS